MCFPVFKDKTEADCTDIIDTGNHRELKRSSFPLHPYRVHLDHKRGVLNHDGLLLDTDEACSCRKVTLGEGSFQPVEIYFPADIINPVKPECNHGALLPG